MRTPGWRNGPPGREMRARPARHGRVEPREDLEDRRTDEREVRPFLDEGDARRLVSGDDLDAHAIAGALQITRVPRIHQPSLGTAD